MQPVKDINCQTCHNSAEIMQASAQKGATLPASDFAVMPKDNILVYFPAAAAQGSGYTQVFKSFDDGHPDFQIQRENLTDPSTLKFNHKLHLGGDIPMVDGKKLDCDYCHKPDSRGAYMQPINFAKNCQACHSLQIDPTLAGFQVPHPSAGWAGLGGSRFPADAADPIHQLCDRERAEARFEEPIRGRSPAFVNQHMLTMRKQYPAGRRPGEQRIFFSNARSIR